MFVGLFDKALYLTLTIKKEGCLLGSEGYVSHTCHEERRPFVGLFDKAMHLTLATKKEGRL